MALRKTDIAYTAGLVDGEGSIIIAKSYSTKYGNCYRITTTIANNNLVILEWVNDKFGGHIHKSNSCYMWQLNGKKCHKFLTSLTPYLKIKSEQAELALQYISTIKHTGCKKLSKTIVKQREKLRRKMQKLNGGRYMVRREKEDVAF